MTKELAQQSKYSLSMLKKAEDYYMECVRDERKMPYIEELGLKLGVDTDTINNWSRDERLEKFGTIKRNIKELQRLRLMQRGLESNKPVMSIFLLKANHGFVETNKQIQENQGFTVVVSDVGYDPNKISKVTVATPLKDPLLIGTVINDKVFPAKGKKPN